MEDPCQGRKRRTASSKASTSAGASNAPSGSGSRTSAGRAGARVGARKSAKTAGTNVVVDGWRLEEFSERLGLAIGRSAQIGDLQICLSAGETDGSEPREMPASVVRWLMTGELPERTST